MVAFKKYITCIMAFFQLCHTKKLQNERKEGFWQIWLLHRIPLYQIRQKIASLVTIEFIDTHVCINNPHGLSSGITTFLCKYEVVISDTLVVSFLDVLFLLVAVILSDFYEKPKGYIESQKKIHRGIRVKDITFQTAYPPFYVIFCYFLCLVSLSLPK